MIRTNRTRLIHCSRFALVACAGLAVVFSGSDQRVNARTQYRDLIGIAAWEKQGITGTGAVVGNLSGLPPLVAVPLSGFRTHSFLTSSNPIQVVYTADGLPRTSFSPVNSHATATAGAMVASGATGRNDPRGITPDAQLLVGWLAMSFDQNGSFSDLPFNNDTSQQFDAAVYTLLGMTDQGVADFLASAGEVLPYRAASVVNSSWGQKSATARRGEDRFARIYNAVVCMTDATLVAPTSNDGGLQPPDDSGGIADTGTVDSPGAAYNTIAVGYLDLDLQSRSANSGIGPSQAQNQADVGNLYPDDLDFVNPFDSDGGDGLDSEGGVFLEARPGVDIVAPGELLTLPGSTFASPLATSTVDEFWSGASFASAIVSSAAALVHELGAREGHNTGALVTKAVLLNSAEKEDSGFSNMAMPDNDDPFRPLITTQALDDEIGGGQLDLIRLLTQYHAGTVKTDYLPGDGIEGFTRGPFAGQVQPDTDSFRYDVVSSGTSPDVPFVTFSEGIMCTFSLGGASIDPLNETDEFFDGGWQGVREVAFAQQYGPFLEPVESLLANEHSGVVPMARRDDPDIGGGGDRQGDLGSGGSGNGGTPTPPAGDDGQEVGGGGGGSGNPPTPYRTGWDHGNIGEGFIDIPIGVITPGSGVSITLAWNRHEILDIPNSRFTSGDLITFAAGGGDGDMGTQDPTSLIEMEYENLDLELYRQDRSGRGNVLVAASRSEWNNTECIFIRPNLGLAPGNTDANFGVSPANYFVRVIFNETVYDYGGFTFCNGGEASSPKNSVARDGLTDLNRAQVEFAMAWYVDFNRFGDQFVIGRDNSVLVGIEGIDNNILNDFFIPVGDINQDLIVDSNDAALLIQNFGSTNPSYDINDDGIVDAVDLSMMSEHVGETATPRKISRDEKKEARQQAKSYKKQVRNQRKQHKKSSKQMTRDAKRNR